MNECLELIRQSQKDPEFQKWLKALQASDGCNQHFFNVSGPGLTLKAFLLAAAWKQFSTTEPASFFLVASDELQLRVWEEALRPWCPDLLVLRPKELDLHGSDARSRKEEHLRLHALNALLSGQPVQILLSAPALLERLPDPKIFRSLCLELDLASGNIPDPDTLCSLLLQAGYEKKLTAEAAGQFARRGDIVDWVPVHWNVQQFGSLQGEGLRLSYFDCELDTCTRFSLETQRSLDNFQEKVWLIPAKEVLLPQSPEERKKYADKIRNQGKASLIELRKNSCDADLIRKLETKLQEEATAFEEGLGRAPVDKWLTSLWPQTFTWLDYWKQVPSPKLPLFLDELNQITRNLDACQAAWSKRCSEALLRGTCLPLVSENQLPRTFCMQQIQQSFSACVLATLSSSGNGLPGAQSFSFRGRESESFRGKEFQLAERLLEGTSPPVSICVQEEERKKKLLALLQEFAVPPDRYRFSSLALPHGFEYPAADLWILGQEEIFLSRSKKPRKRSKSFQLDLFSDLKPGDLVVHETHGIARYEGLENVEHKGVRRDYLLLSYAKGDRLFLPMEALDQIQKYIGSSDNNPPKLSRLGGGEWNRLKEKARASVRSLATDLVKLYARRRKQKGYAFPAQNDWEKNFADSFPFEETEDQLQSLREIYADMESDAVMDRLLCGDVGFGKTEVAFRALFKCAICGKQAAFLAPTTVLAQQHYSNFLNRLEDFPLRVGLLSRFAPEALQKKTLKGLRDGSIDVVIGTHRMLSKDVVFKDLGLLVIDEEQRFGVDHKESLKALYPDVDVLTLSATPIPRTLHMSLSGIRPISVLQEPPVDRRAVLTYVLEYEEEVIREAMLRELSRGGQVFYLFNNTHKIAEKVVSLQELLPGARIVYAHGKMGEHKLEAVVDGFLAGEADVLVCTTIIESGIDMPNVNTLIVEQADCLGLAQLYQLRGRVGRAGRQAYAYITYRRDKILSEVATQRLTAIRDYTELGAGFKIALRDLEVRGAGNLLGGEQHGQMAAVGYDLYCRMLDEEIQAARALEEGIAEEAEQIRQTTPGLLPAALFKAVETQVDLPVDAYLSRTFIPDEGQRMDVYRKLTALASLESYHDVLEELMDRFGDLPTEVQMLASLSYVRHRAGLAGILQISYNPTERKIFLPLVAEGALPMEQLASLLAVQNYEGQLQFLAGAKPALLFQVQSERMEGILKELRQLFMRAEEHMEELQTNQGKGKKE